MPSDLALALSGTQTSDLAAPTPAPAASDYRPISPLAAALAAPGDIRAAETRMQLSKQAMVDRSNQIGSFQSPAAAGQVYQSSQERLGAPEPPADLYTRGTAAEAGLYANATMQVASPLLKMQAGVSQILDDLRGVQTQTTLHAQKDSAAAGDIASQANPVTQFLGQTAKYLGVAAAGPVGVGALAAESGLGSYGEARQAGVTPFGAAIQGGGQAAVMGTMAVPGLSPLARALGGEAAELPGMAQAGLRAAMGVGDAIPQTLGMAAVGSMGSELAAQTQRDLQARQFLQEQAAAQRDPGAIAENFGAMALAGGALGAVHGAIGGRQARVQDVQERQAFQQRLASEQLTRDQLQAMQQTETQEREASGQQQIAVRQAAGQQNVRQAFETQRSSNQVEQDTQQQALAGEQAHGEIAQTAPSPENLQQLQQRVGAQQAAQKGVGLRQEVARHGLELEQQRLEQDLQGANRLADYQTASAEAERQSQVAADAGARQNVEGYRTALQARDAALALRAQAEPEAVEHQVAVTQTRGKLENLRQSGPNPYVIGDSGLGSHFDPTTGRAVIDGHMPPETRGALAALEHVEGQALLRGTPFAQAHEQGVQAQRAVFARTGIDPAHGEGLIDAALKKVVQEPKFSHPVLPQQLLDSGAPPQVVEAGRAMLPGGIHAGQIRSDQGPANVPGQVQQPGQKLGGGNLQQPTQTGPGPGNRQRDGGTGRGRPATRVGPLEGQATREGGAGTEQTFKQSLTEGRTAAQAGTLRPTGAFEAPRSQEVGQAGRNRLPDQEAGRENPEPRRPIEPGPGEQSAARTSEPGILTPPKPGASLEEHVAQERANQEAEKFRATEAEKTIAERAAAGVSPKESVGSAAEVARKKVDLAKTRLVLAKERLATVQERGDDGAQERAVKDRETATTELETAKADHAEIRAKEAQATTAEDTAPAVRERTLEQVATDRRNIESAKTLIVDKGGGTISNTSDRGFDYTLGNGTTGRYELVNPERAHEVDPLQYRRSAEGQSGGNGLRDILNRLGPEVTGRTTPFATAEDARTWYDKNVWRQSYDKASGVNRPETTRKGLAIIAKMLEVAPTHGMTLDGAPIGKDVLIRVVKGLNAATHGEVLDHELAHLAWKLMPKADQAIAMKGMGVSDPKAAVEAFPNWLASVGNQQKYLADFTHAPPTGLIGRIIAAVRRFFGAVPEVGDIFHKASRGEYFRETAADAELSAKSPETPDKTYAVGPGGEPGFKGAAQRTLDVMREEKSGEPLTREELQRKAGDLRGSLGNLDAQRDHANVLMNRLENGDTVSPVEAVFLQKLAVDDHAKLIDAKTPYALGQFSLSGSARNAAATVWGAIGRALQYDHFATPELRGQEVMAQVFSMRGANAELYRRLNEKLHTATASGNKGAVTSIKEKMAQVSEAEGRKGFALRQRVLRAYGIDLFSPRLGEVLGNKDYALAAIDNFNALRRGDFTAGDLINTTLLRNILSNPSTALKFLESNAVNTLYRETIKPMIEATMHALTGNRFEDGRTFQEVYHMQKALALHFWDAVKNAGRSYKAEHDVLEHAVMGDSTSTMAHGDSGHDVPDVIQALTGSKILRYTGTKPIAFHDALFKSWGAYADVASYAYHEAKSKGLGGEAVGNHIDDALRNPTEHPEVWQKAYSNARPITGQESKDPTQTGARIRNALRALQTVRGLTLPGGIKPGLFILPLINTSAMMVRQSVRVAWPTQLIRMGVHAWDGVYGATNPNRTRAIQSDLSDLAFGAMLHSGVAMLTSAGLITGSDPDWKSPEGKMAAQGLTLKPYHIATPFGLVSYKYVEPLSRAVGAYVDYLQGKSRSDIFGGLTNHFLVQQLDDLVSLAQAIGTTDPKATGNAMRIAARMTASLAVPNLITTTTRWGIQAGEGGRERPQAETAKQAHQGAVQNFAENVATEASGGLIFQKPVKVDHWGQDVTSAPYSYTMLPTKLLGNDIDLDRRTTWDVGLEDWNKTHGGKERLVIAAAPMEYTTSGGGKEALTLEERGEYAKAAGPELLKRFNGTGFDPEKLTASRVMFLKAICARVQAETLHTLTPKWGKGLPDPNAKPEP